MRVIIVLAICIVVVACNNSDTSRKGIVDSAKATVDSPKAVIADSSTMIHDSAANKK